MIVSSSCPVCLLLLLLVGLGIAAQRFSIDGPCARELGLHLRAGVEPRRCRRRGGCARGRGAKINGGVGTDGK